MSALHIKLTGDRTAFAPGDEVTGAVNWKFDKPPPALELRLFWFTRGKGTTDVGVVETVRFDGVRAHDQREFRLRLPAQPYSFSGRLISLIWALELVAVPGNDSARQEIIVAPGGREVVLQK